MNEKRKRLYKRKKTALKIQNFKRKNDYKNIKKFLYITIGVVVFFIFVAIVYNVVNEEKIHVFSSRLYLKENGVRDDSKCNDEFVEKVDLVKMDEYYLGKGVIDGESFYRFKVVKKGIESYDIEISDGQCSIKKLPVEDTSIPKVEVYRRTYDNGLKVYFYVIYIKDTDIKDLGGE